MPLWQLFAREGTFSQAEKQRFAEAITDIYSDFGLPRFYVSVVFHDVPEGSFFVGGVARSNFVRISIDHIARRTSSDHRESLLKLLNKTIHPFVRDRGLDWELHVDETPRDLWTIQGMAPPLENSELEKRWARSNLPIRAEP